MTCSEIRELIYAYIDGELDLVHSLDIEKHIGKCSACTTTFKNLEVLRSAINTDSLYYSPPYGFQNMILKGVLKKDKAEAIKSYLSSHLVGIGTFAIIAALIILVFIPTLSDVSSDNLLMNEIITSHVRSLMADHLTDVTTSDRHTVKPWFNGKLDFSPQVQDFADHGFTLVGGRLDYLNDRAVASLVYRHKLHLINLYIWPSEGGIDIRVKSRSKKGYNLINWDKSGMTYWAISDLNNIELQEFVKLIQNQP
ncbi:MAG: anti-sigma factor family protein [Thermodesulfobacteriota bacterium]